VSGHHHRDLHRRDLHVNFLCLLRRHDHDPRLRRRDQTLLLMEVRERRRRESSPLRNARKQRSRRQLFVILVIIPSKYIGTARVVRARTGSFTSKYAPFLMAVGAPSAEWRDQLEHVLREGAAILNLEDMYLGNAEAVEIAARLRGSKTSVTRLNLDFNEIEDAGASAIAELLRADNGECEDISRLEWVELATNSIGRGGVAALADALKYNTSVKRLWIGWNPRVDPIVGDSSDGEAEAGINSLVSAIGVNTTLETVGVAPQFQRGVDALLADKEGRRRGRERFLTGSLTKAARKRD
jgi:Leucine Rich repeat